MFISVFIMVKISTGAHTRAIFVISTTIGGLFQCDSFQKINFQKYSMQNVKQLLFCFQKVTHARTQMLQKTAKIEKKVN